MHNLPRLQFPNKTQMVSHQQTKKKEKKGGGAIVASFRMRFGKNVLDEEAG
jgi:hypothetical protein